MKKMILSGIAALATIVCATVFAFDLNVSTNDDNSFAIRNAELLAQGGIVVTITATCEGSGNLSCPTDNRCVEKVTITTTTTITEDIKAAAN
jgi:hypothetical protein